MVGLVSSLSWGHVDGQTAEQVLMLPQPAGKVLAFRLEPPQLCSPMRSACWAVAGCPPVSMEACRQPATAVLMHNDGHCLAAAQQTSCNGQDLGTLAPSLQEQGPTRRSIVLRHGFFLRIAEPVNCVALKMWFLPSPTAAFESSALRRWSSCTGGNWITRCAAHRAKLVTD